MIIAWNCNIRRFPAHIALRRIRAAGARSLRRKSHAVRPTRNADPLAHERRKVVENGRAGFESVGAGSRRFRNCLRVAGNAAPGSHAGQGVGTSSTFVLEVSRPGSARCGMPTLDSSPLFCRAKRRSGRLWDYGSRRPGVRQSGHGKKRTFTGAGRKQDTNGTRRCFATLRY